MGAWVFEVRAAAGGAGDEQQFAAGTLTVHKGTGHWSATINTETGALGKGVYAYECTFRRASGSYETNMVIAQADLDWLRKHAVVEQQTEQPPSARCDMCGSETGGVVPCPTCGE